MNVPSIINGWTELELLSNDELLELANHLDALRSASKLHEDEKDVLRNLNEFDSFVGGLRNQYRQRVIKLAAI